MHIKRAGAMTKLLIVILLVAAAVALLEIDGRLGQAQARREELDRQVTAQLQTNAQLADAIEHSDDPERIADVAREKLGLVEPGEIVFYSMGD